MIVLFLNTCGMSEDSLLDSLKYDSRTTSRPISRSKMTHHGVKYTSRGHKMDIYRPMGVPIREKLPVVLALHSGAFVKGNRNNPIIKRYANDIAASGEFVVAVLDYTKLSDIGVIIKNRVKAKSHFVEFPLQDIRNAIVHLQQHQSDYGVLGDSILLFGYSAGGCVVNELLVSHDTPPPSILGGVSIAGFLSKREPIEYKEVHRPILMIHGSDDQLVPYTIGRPFPDYTDDLKIDLPGAGAEVGIDGRKTIYSILPHLRLPKSWMNQLVEWLIEDVVGSKGIQDRFASDSHMELLTIEGAPHQFMINDHNEFTRSYEASLERVLTFLKKTANRSH